MFRVALRRAGRGALACAVLSGPAACTDRAPEVPVSFTGVVTLSGQPVSGATVTAYRPQISGLPEYAGETTTGADGSYAISTATQEIKCILVFIEVEVRDAQGTVVASGRTNAQECGDNLADFTL